MLDRFQAPADTDLCVWNRVFEVNSTAPMLMTRAVVPFMQAQGGGVIVNTISAAGIRGGAAGAAYTASKSALVGLTKNVASMYGRENIRCNGVCPGAVSTDIMASAPGELQASTFDRLPGIALMGRSAEPEEIANVILFLASDLAGFVNGVILPVDGGWAAA